MKVRFSIHLLIIVGLITFVVVMPVVFSRAQQNAASSMVQDQATAVTAEQIAVQAAAHRQALYNNRVPHPACPNCFKVAEDNRYGVYEEVPGTGILIPRKIPDPDLLEVGETLPEFDEEGERIWYIGHQGIVGPTDEDLVSEQLPVPKIELRRIQARHMTAIFTIRGVHGFGIRATGFSVFLDPESSENQKAIPSTLEGIPVEVVTANAPTFRSHFDLYKRPVEIADGIQPDGAPGIGTLGPHIVQNSPTCCKIWSLTASHVVQDLNAPPPIGKDVYQAGQIAGNLWGKVAYSWSNLTCNTVADPNCTRPSAPVNWTDQTPDIAAIAHIALNHMDGPRDDKYVPTGAEPTRKMRYGRSPGSYVNGPSGIMRSPSIGTNLKMWGSHTDANNAKRVTDADLVVVVSTDNQLFKYKYCCVDRLDILSVDGDSGGLIAYDGTGNRHVAGVLFAGNNDANGNPIVGTYFTKAIDIYDAFNNAHIGFHHFWGTSSGFREPAVTQCDGSC